MEIILRSYKTGHCCRCSEGWTGNGHTCIVKGDPVRISGNFEGVINGKPIDKTGRFRNIETLEMISFNLFGVHSNYYQRISFLNKQYFQTSTPSSRRQTVVPSRQYPRSPLTSATPSFCSIRSDPSWDGCSRLQDLMRTMDSN